MRRLACALVLATLPLACGGAESRPAKGPAPPIAASVVPPAPREARAAVLPPDASKVTFERIAKSPEPGWNMPRAAQHAPDGRITYLASEDADETMALFAFDPKTQKSAVLLRARDLRDASEQAAKLSREEELRRERQRERIEGITTYGWAKKASVLLVPQGGDVFVRTAAGQTKRLTKTKEPEIDPKICATGERVGFVRGGELFTVDVATGKETALTKPRAKDSGVTHGLSDYVAQEELGEPSGWFWSPACDRIAYLEVDDSPVEKVAVLGYRNDAPDLMMQRYPRAGAKNPAVRLGVVDLATKQTRWVTLPREGEHYLGRFQWSPDGKALFAQAMTRDQKRVALLRVDPASGKAVELTHETSKAWVAFSPMRILEKTGDLLFTRTETGHRHIEILKPTDGSVIRRLTAGDWDVEAIAGVDEGAGKVLFSGTKDGAVERHLYAVPLSSSGAPADVTRLTPDRGVHSVKVDESGTTWVDVHSARDRPPRADVVKNGAKIAELTAPRSGASDPEIAELALRAPEIVKVPNAEGQLLDALVLRPRAVVGRHPVVVMVYGGPESQAVFDSWAPRLLWQHLADRGFVVFQLDNRGCGGRGRAFAQQVHKKLGVLELEDQIAGARWLAQQPYVDGGRIGVYGHSYGGFMAAAAMLDERQVFRAGVAGSPVTDWRLYDTGYTERYMETPETNAAGYAATDLARRADKLSGHLLLTHAMMDENVHYAHSAHLIDALIAARKHFDLFVLPGERHGVRAPAARAYMPEKIVSYFVDHL